MGKAQTGLKRTMRGTFPNLKNGLHYNTIQYATLQLDEFTFYDRNNHETRTMHVHAISTS